MSGITDEEAARRMLWLCIGTALALPAIAALLDLIL